MIYNGLGFILIIKKNKTLTPPSYDSYLLIQEK